MIWAGMRVRIRYKYHSISGHAFMIGENSQKFLTIDACQRPAQNVIKANSPKKNLYHMNVQKIIPGHQNQWNAKQSD